jgi:hypothetical protein
MLIIDMIGQGHLVRVNTLFDTEFRHNDIKRAVEYAHHSSGTNDRTESLCKIMNKVAEMQMGGLLLSDLRRI